MKVETKHLGYTAQDILSSVEGIIYGFTVYASGTVNVCLIPQGPSEGQKRHEGIWVEQYQLTLLDGKPLACTPLNKQKFKNLDKVQHVASNLIGDVLAISYWMNGCVRYSVRFDGVNPKTGLPYEEQTFDDYELKAYTKPKKETVSSRPSRSTGGPERFRPNSR